MDWLSAAKTLLTRCDELARLSESKQGLTRTFLSSPMRDAHRLVGSWMEAARLAVRLDAAGNIIGRRPSTKPDARTLLLGSHLDTVKNAGKYDGALGVLLGISVVEALPTTRLPFHLDVVGFSEEEGVRFGVPFIGSRAVAGTLSPDLLALSDENGVTVKEAISAFGLNPDELATAAYNPDEVLGYLEVHPEQALRLATADEPLAAVSAIVGSSRARLTFRGEAGHAGTSPMDLRHDALAGAASFVLAAEQLARETPELVATVGQLELSPGAINVIPGEVTLGLDLRHAEDTVRQSGVNTLQAKATVIAGERGLTLDWQLLLDQAAVPMDPGLTSLLSDAAKCPVIPSGAGHDAMVLGTVIPAAMLFVRSPNGVSHHPAETVRVEDVAVALETVTNVVRQLAAQDA